MTEEEGALVEKLTLGAALAFVRGGPNPVWALIERLREQDKRIEDLEARLATARLLLITAGARRKAV